MEKQSKYKYFQCNLREGYLMKKLALALIVALGVASVNAAPTATDSDVAAALTKSVPNLKLDAVKKNAAITWIKANPGKTAAIAALALAGLVYGGAALLKKAPVATANGATTTDSLKWYNRAANNVWHCGAEAPAKFVAQKVGATCTAVKNNVVNHKVAYGVSAGVVAVITAAVVDMVLRGDKSVVKTLWNMINKKPAAQPAVVQ
jgi:hypothetical protein